MNSIPKLIDKLTELEAYEEYLDKYMKNKADSNYVSEKKKVSNKRARINKKLDISYYEEKYLEFVILELEKFNKDSIYKIKDEFKKFIKNTKLDELNILRKGEVLLGKKCNDLTLQEDIIKDRLYNIIDNMENIGIPAIIAIVSAYIYLEINFIENNSIKEEA